MISELIILIVSIIKQMKINHFLQELRAKKINDIPWHYTYLS